MLEQTLPVKFTVRPGVSVTAGRQQVGGHVSHCSHIRHDLNDLIDRRQLREKLGVDLALEDIRRDGMARLVGLFQTIRVRLVQEHLGFEDCGGLQGNGFIIAERQVQ